MFPAYIVSHLESCQASSVASGDQPSSSGASSSAGVLGHKRFICSLNVGISNEAILSLVEQNQYQTLVHVALKLRQGNDDAVKRHLASRLKETRDANEQLRKNVASLDDGYSKATSTNE